MKRTLMLALGLALAAPLPALAQEDEGDKKGPFKPFAEVTKDTEVQEGYFDLYSKAEKLFAAVPQDRLDQDFLMTAELARGIGARGLFGGTMLTVFEGMVVAIERHGDKLYLVQRPHRYTATRGGSATHQIELAYGSSVLAVGKIEAIREDSALVVDIYPWIVSDLIGVQNWLRFALATQPGRPGSASFDKSRSYLEYSKSFPENVSLQASLTFKTNNPPPLRTVPDSRFLPLALHYTWAKLPEEPMTARAADERMGYFLTVHKDYSLGDSTFFTRYANRWRLERGEQVGDLWEPKEPITYYIDRTVPEKYRPYMKAGVENWNRAFEAAGWKNAIRALDLPEDADAEDIRYATLRWGASDQNGYGAIGPSTVDPRTGEILDADILFEPNFILGFYALWRNMASPQALVESALGVDAAELERLELGLELSTMAAHISEQGNLMKAALTARGEMEPGDPVPDEFVGQVLNWVAMHEVGHSLGLRHNFGSSRATPNEELHNKDWSESNGLVASVMDYHAANLARPGEPNGYYYTPGVGSYDEWIISFGYTDDAEWAAELARQGAALRHAYGTDLDAFIMGVDPRVNIYDLGEDPLAWGIERTEIVSELIEELPKRVLSDNSSYSDLRVAYTTLVGQYAIAMLPAVKYIGGQYYYNTRFGDPEDHGPFKAVPRDKQVQALQFLAHRAFSEEAFAVPQSVVQQLGENRWFHWGSNAVVNGRMDYAYYDQVLGIQTALLNQLTHPIRLSRIRDAEFKFGAQNIVTIPELFEALTREIWSEAWSAPGRNIPTARRDLQRAYIDRMTEILVDPPSGTPADARAVARVVLQDVHDRISRRITPPFNFDSYTYAHLAESKARIEKALEASLEVEID